jgi:hypothetical protein
MNGNSEIQTLLYKFISNQCTTEETNEVVNYFKKNKLTNAFPTVEDIKSSNKDIPEMDASTADKIFSTILVSATEIEKTTVKIKKPDYLRYIAVAASIAVLFSIGLVTYKNEFSKQENKLILNGNEITLQLSNGTIQVISEGKVVQVTDANGTIIGNQNGNKIIYDSENTSDKLTYNTLKIPYGKRFELQLSDGTRVHLNSGTTLKYPVKFIANQNRQVFLEGEAFFDVAKDKKHPFIVNANDLNIRVLGTHFNVSNYPEDELTDVVLVEGSVGLFKSNETFDVTKNILLKPGFLGSFNKINSQIASKEVNTDFYTSWMKGYLSFRNMKFKDIAKKLERHYNITIVNQNSKLDEEKFYANFNDEPIEKVLSYINEIHSIQYKINNNQIIIK